MRLLAIDPGPEESAWALYDTDTRQPVTWEKKGNAVVLGLIRYACHGWGAERMAIEMVASYGMPVGAEVFETCVWTGRFVQQWRNYGPPTPPVLVYRRDVKLHLCGNTRAKDSNVRQAIIDRYGPGRNVAVGTKAKPGPLHGMKADCWQALAVAITAAETSGQESAA